MEGHSKAMRAAFVAACVTGLAAAPASAQSAAAGGDVLVTAGAYTAPQAERGKVLFREHCADCHPVRQFTGAPFLRQWAGQRVFDFFDQIRMTMPNTNPGGLTRQQYADIVAHLLSENTLPAGDAPLPADDDALKKIRFAPRAAAGND
jgi:S-disulfanyl-L-cysteine oxidoreductase SoxD